MLLYNNAMMDPFQNADRAACSRNPSQLNMSVLLYSFTDIFIALSSSNGWQEATQSRVRGFQGENSRCLQHVVGSNTKFDTFDDSRSYSAEAEKQVKGFSHAEFRGYTEDDGGYNAAVKAFEDYTRKHEHPLKQLQTPPRTQTVKRKERPASWQAEKDAPCKVQQIKNDGRGLGAQASIVTKIPHTAASSAPSASSYSSTSVTDSREARSEDSTSDKGSSSSEDSASEEDGETPRFKNPLKDNGRSTCVEKDKTSDSSSDHGNSESTSDSDAMDEHRDDADKDTRQDFRHSNPRNKAVSALDGSNSINLRDGNKNGFSYHPQLGKPQASELRYDLSPILRQDQTLTKRRLALFNRASERPSTSSTDYGDFPDDPGLLQWSQNLPVKAEPDMDSKPIIKNKDHGQDRKLLNYLPFLIPKTEPELCKEQKDLVNLILSGDNVFFTGSAGCGKVHSFESHCP